MTTSYGERLVIINDSSPAYRLVSVSFEDLKNDGKINPNYFKDIQLPSFSLPAEVRLICTEPFGKGVFVSVGRVSPFREPGFYVDRTELNELVEIRAKKESLFTPLDRKAGIIRLEIHCKKNPSSGILWCEVDFKFPTEEYKYA